MTPRDTLIAYLRMKVDQADWHGVADAANDLRVLEAQAEAFQASAMLAGKSQSVPIATGRS